MDELLPACGDHRAMSSRVPVRSARFRPRDTEARRTIAGRHLGRPVVFAGYLPVSCRASGETMAAEGPERVVEHMAAVMVERDAVLAAVHSLIEEALEGRGGALFVVGEAGLGKTTVLEHAAAAARGRFR